MNVYFNNFEISNSLHIWDGHNFYCNEQSKRILNFEKNNLIKCYSHDFMDFVLNIYSKKYDFSEGVLYCNAGPYAYIYYLHREIHNGSWPIIREVGAGFWIGYFFQEWLCSPLARDYDKTLFASYSSIQIYRKAFSYSTGEIYRCYPFVDILSEKKKNFISDDLTVRLGYIGRMSFDKNIEEIVLSYIKLYEIFKNKKIIELHLLGSEYDYSIKKIKSILKSKNIPEYNLKYYGGKVSQVEVEKFYSSIDILLFLSTSNVETLGRVVIESAVNNISVVMTNYAAGTEFYKKENLVNFAFSNEWHNMYDLVNLGIVNVDLIVNEVIKRIKNHVLPSINHMKNDSEMFLSILNKNNIKALLYDSYQDKYSFQFKGLNYLTKIKARKKCIKATELLEKYFVIDKKNNNIDSYQDLSLYPKEIPKLMKFNPKFRLLIN